MERKKIIAGVVIIAAIILAVMTYLSWFSVQEGQATLEAYVITINPDGSGSSTIMANVDKTLIGNATHVTEQDLSQYPALAEVLTGERAGNRGFARMGGVSPGDEYVFAKKFYVSEYKGQYYILLVKMH